MKPKLDEGFGSGHCTHTQKKQLSITLFLRTAALGLFKELIVDRLGLGLKKQTKTKAAPIPFPLMWPTQGKLHTVRSGGPTAQLLLRA